MKDLFGIAFSFVVVALMIYAVILFITSGATSLFYAVVVIDLAISFINAWFISTGRYERIKTEVKWEEAIVAAPIAAPRTIAPRAAVKRPRRKRSARRTSK